jgi:hypothetical protein
VIIEEESAKKVFIVENERAVEKFITIGIIDPPLAEITQGLSEGEIVVTEGFYALKNGIKVIIKETSEEGVRNREPA